MKLLFDCLASPIGDLLIVSDGASVCGVEFGAELDHLIPHLRRRYGAFGWIQSADPVGATSCLRAYFDGALHALDEVRVDCGGTPFQARVWAALRQIPTGATISYGELARRIGNPTAVRAVGLANGSNPVPLVVPCHRVIGSGGSLTGYGGGLDRKSWLLEHEGVLLSGTRAPVQWRHAKAP
jgi:methylated-DNA-[protein]-cysteine S-methyltransferase